MHIRLVAVGDRQPAWVDEAFDSYASRLPRTWRFALHSLATESRKRSGNDAAAKKSESEKLLARLKPDDFVVLLDERGRQMCSRALGKRLSDWELDGRDVALVIGGPDGVADVMRKRADFEWSLSELTLPHGLARVLVAEQLYRAWSISTGHPYHRD